MEINYTELFFELKDYLIRENPESTKKITTTIQKFFDEKYSDDNKVLSSYNPQDANTVTKNKEYLVDILVTNFDPLEVINSSNKTLELQMKEPFKLYLAIESELGGPGGSAANGVHKNVVEDYIKLLAIQANFKVLIFTSLAYGNEKDHVAKRVENLFEIYSKFKPSENGILLIHLPGDQSIRKEITSNQVQVAITDAITGYIISSSTTLTKI